METQAKLLRVNQEKEFMPLGWTETVRVDVRILAATNAELRKLVEEGKFREDLYYRLNVINLILPPLRERKEAIEILMDHNWPGNVRELENVVERAVVLASHPTVMVDVLPEHLLHGAGIRIRRDEGGGLPSDASLFEIVAGYERRVIIEHLETANWRQTDAAEKLRVPLSTLNQKIKRLNIEVRKKSELARTEKGG